MKRFLSVVMFLLIAQLFSTSVFAKNRYEIKHTIGKNGFLCHLLERKDTGWSFFAELIGVPENLLRLWNPELDRKEDPDYFPEGAPVRYKTRDMLVKGEIEDDLRKEFSELSGVNQEELRKKILEAEMTFRTEIVNLQHDVSALSENVDGIVVKINEINESIFSEKKVKVAIFGGLAFVLLIVMIFFFQVRRRISTSEDDQHKINEEIVEALKQKRDINSCISFVIKEQGFEYTYFPLLTDKGISCPLIKNGKDEVYFYSIRKNVKNSLKSALRDNLELFEIIQNNPEKLGKIERKKIEDCRGKNAGS